MLIKVDIKVTAPELVECINRLTANLPNLSTVQETLKVEENIEKAAEINNEIKNEEKEEKEDKKTKTSKKTTDGSRIPGGVTLEVVRAKLALLSQSGKQAQVKELIEKFGASKLSDIPKSKYASLLREAEAL